ncbi:MAG: ribonuclease E/G [Pseudomonadota bacterium]
MKGRVIVLPHRPAHAALVVDGRLDDLLLQDAGAYRQPLPGEIWAAKLTRTVQGAAFVDLGGGHTGYLRDAKGLRPGADLAVQISATAEPGKAVPVDRRLLIKGRTLILTPGAPGVNVSRQIKDPDERERLSAAFPDTPDDLGVIVRSAARGITEDVLTASFESLAKGLSKVQQLDQSQGLILGTSDPQAVALREWTIPIPEMIAATDAAQEHLDWDAHPEVLEHDPDLADALRFGGGDPFDHFGVWDEIEKLKSPRADLPSGGWMAIEATRAMVTVDVNTGDGFGGGDAMTANIEAARELPRQLRLRGLGGQIVIDFAPLKKQHRKKLEEELKRAFRKCPIETSLAGWTPLGSMELTRKRERRPLTELLPD